MKPTAKVLKTEGNIATVLLKNPEACHSCDFARFCHIEDTGREIICKNNKGASIGDVVELDIKRKNIILATLLTFMLPIFLLVGGTIIGKFLWQTEIAGFLIGMGFIFLYFAGLFFIKRKLLKKNYFLPEIVNIKESY